MKLLEDDVRRIMIVAYDVIAMYLFVELNIIDMKR